MESLSLQSVHALRRAGRLADAESLCRQILSRDGSCAEAAAVLGLLVGERGEIAEAIALLRRAVELEPKCARHRGNLAAVLARVGRERDAEALLVEAIALEPAYLPAHLNLGALRMTQGSVREAADAFAAAVELAPTDVAASRGLAAALLELGDVQGVMAALRRLLALAPDSPTVHSDLLFAMLHDEQATPMQLLEEAKRWAGKFAVGRVSTRQVAGVEGEWRVDFGELSRAETRPTGRPLRIGYLSPDFRRHTIAKLITPILEHHDRSRFEVFCYSAVTQPDEMTGRLRKLADAWRDIAALDDAQAEKMIRADRIDILVDLAGHMNGNRLTLLSRRPAPIQVQLGYAGTTGLDAIDYRITDVHCDPPEQTQGFHTEKLVHLPACAWCYEPDADVPEAGPVPALANGYVTFCCLNRAAKLSEGTLALWSQILRNVQRSRLVLLGAQRDGDNAYLREKVASAGIDLARVRMLERQPRPRYLAALAACDIALDPFPYNGDTTTCDALWMGVPVVTLAGERFAARRGVGLLAAVGLDELVASTPQEYVDVAISLSADLGRLAELRAGLRQRLRESPLTDGRWYARELETRYEQMK